MSGSVFQRVREGQEFIPSAAKINAWTRAAEITLASQRTGINKTGRELYIGGAPQIKIRNDWGSDVGRFGILQILDSSIVFDPADSDALSSFQNSPVVCGGTPQGYLHLPFAVTVEPIREDEIGGAIISGPAVVSVDVTDEDHGFAMMKEGDSAKLKSSIFGHRILYKEAGTGTKSAIVNIGDLSPMVLYGSVGSGGMTAFTPGSGAFGSGDVYFEAWGKIFTIANHYPGQLLSGDLVEIHCDDTGAVFCDPVEYGEIRLVRATVAVAAGSSGSFQFMGGSPGGHFDTAHDPVNMFSPAFSFLENDEGLATLVNRQFWEVSPRVCG